MGRSLLRTRNATRQHALQISVQAIHISGNYNNSMHAAICYAEAHAGLGWARCEGWLFHPRTVRTQVASQIAANAQCYKCQIDYECVCCVCCKVLECWIARFGRRNLARSSFRHHSMGEGIGVSDIPRQQTDSLRANAVPHT